MHIAVRHHDNNICFSSSNVNLKAVFFSKKLSAKANAKCDEKLLH